jgi:hypothetical protein
MLGIRSIQFISTAIVPLIAFFIIARIIGHARLTR